MPGLVVDARPGRAGTWRVASRMAGFLPRRGPAGPAAGVRGLGFRLSVRGRLAARRRTAASGRLAPARRRAGSGESQMWLPVPLSPDCPAGEWRCPSASPARSGPVCTRRPPRAAASRIASAYGLIPGSCSVQAQISRAHDAETSPPPAPADGRAASRRASRHRPGGRAGVTGSPPQPRPRRTLTVVPVAAARHERRQYPARAAGSVTRSAPAPQALSLHNPAKTDAISALARNASPACAIATACSRPAPAPAPAGAGTVGGGRLTGQAHAGTSLFESMFPRYRQPPTKQGVNLSAHRRIPRPGAGMYRRALVLSMPAAAVHSPSASEFHQPARAAGGDEDKGPRLACILLVRSYIQAGRRGPTRQEDMIMTQNKAQKSVIRQRMAETGEPYSVARRSVQDRLSRAPPRPGKIPEGHGASAYAVTPAALHGDRRGKHRRLGRGVLRGRCGQRRHHRGGIQGPGGG